ncbi:tyrosine-type recombinase/integrase [Lysobacter capsici]|uniref:tyrosine-type recombinase/integrase n=1 Tax=Lysobacter capsici TaxID=435897 RepID=UPI001BFFE538|nr:site-specific integrase [Lysobacter capsici]QWF19139.1 integrase arm-type DNA-binding domain-containing protein [Lysobacter capsici]
MARVINRLTARQVATAKPGHHADGGGLYLQVTDSLAKSWVFRYERLGRRREMGLGSVQVVTLQEARQKAMEQRRLLARGEDPLALRVSSRASGLRTWGECVDEYIAKCQPEWKNDAQAHQWEQSLRDYGPDRKLPVTAIDTPTVVACLNKIWTTKTETATRVRNRIERVWDWAKYSNLVAGENPARWKGHLIHVFPKASKVKKVKHHAAMPYAEVPALMRQLRKSDIKTCNALRFTILTAARTEETVGARWEEFNFAKARWVIPAERMKGGEAHVVPLCTEALAILNSLPRDRPPFSLSENTMLFYLQKPKNLGLPYTVHGFRSTFRDWAAEETDVENHIVEMALAHKIKDKTEAAYRRGQLIAKRRELMQAWEAYLSTG